MNSGKYILLGVCGLYCGACYHLRASLPEGQHLLAEAGPQGRGLAGFTCAGCRSTRLYVHPGCAQCQIRACAGAQGVLHCGLCAQFPCERLMAFQHDGRPHHLAVTRNLETLQAQGPDRWLADQAKRWMCDCGTQFSWYEVQCPACGAALDSHGPDPRGSKAGKTGPPPQDSASETEW